VADDAAPIISGALRYEGTRTILTISRRHEQDPAKWVGVRDGKTIVLEHEVNSLSLTIQP
jgi:hypothetical protein